VPVANTLTNVTPENVLKARTVILAEAESVAHFVQERFSAQRLIGLCGGDPISRDAQEIATHVGADAQDGSPAMPSPAR